jgi:hypothetical protein
MSDENIQDALFLCEMGVIEISPGGTVAKMMRRHNGEWVLRRHPKIVGTPNRAGYLVYQWIDILGRNRSVRVNRLVYARFNGPLLSGYEVHHRDNNKLNNHPDNLEQVSHTQNMRLAADDGLYKSVVGNNNPCARVTDVEIEKACILLRQRLGVPRVARALGVTLTTINNMIRGRTWQHLRCVQELRRDWPDLKLAHGNTSNH